MSRLQFQGGPDAQAFVLHDDWSLGANRLAIQGVDSGLQPYWLAGNICAVFNGEIYNHDVLRAKLAAHGYHIEGNCDGDLIPALYELYGVDFVCRLDGMFALAVIDLRSKPKLIIVSDPAGIKSLYWYWNASAHTLIFSSELPALRLVHGIGQTLRPEMIDLYMSMQAVLGTQTIHTDIQCLPPSTSLTVELGREPIMRRYETEVRWDTVLADSLQETGAQLHSLLSHEVGRMLQADVPVCLVVSGGLDSSLLTAIAAKATSRPHAFNISYTGDWPDDERHYARSVAEHCGVTYHQVEIEPAQFPGLIERMIPHLGQPNSAPHCLSTYALFEAISSEGFKVAITGEGADEMFGGYDRFALALERQGMGDNKWLEQYLDAMGAIPAALRQNLYTRDFEDALLLAAPARQRFADSLRDASAQHLDGLLAIDQYDRFPYYILRRVDHLSMAHSVEVRVPFCQPRVASFARRLPTSYKIEGRAVKRVVYEAARDQLPCSVLHRKKQPFTLPIAAMMQKGLTLFDFIQDIFNDSCGKLYSYIDFQRTKALLEEQGRVPRAGIAKTLWTLAIFELWLRHQSNPQAEMVE